MTLIRPYLQSYLKAAGELQELFPEAPMDTIEGVQQKLRDLVDMVANRDHQIERLYAQLEEQRAKERT